MLSPLPPPNKSSNRYLLYYPSFGKPSSTLPLSMVPTYTSHWCHPLLEAGIWLILIRFSRMQHPCSLKALRILIVMLELGSRFFAGIKRILTSRPSTTSIKVMRSTGMPSSQTINTFWRKKPDKLSHKATSIANTFWDTKLLWSTLTDSNKKTLILKWQKPIKVPTSSSWSSVVHTTVGLIQAKT